MSLKESSRECPTRPPSLEKGPIGVLLHSPPLVPAPTCKPAPSEPPGGLHGPVPDVLTLQLASPGLARLPPSPLAGCPQPAASRIPVAGSTSCPHPLLGLPLAHFAKRPR